MLSGFLLLLATLNIHLEISNKCTTLEGSVSALASWELALSTVLFGALRCWFVCNVHPLCIVLLFAIALVGYCHAEVASIDLQVPGWPPTSTYL
jgi:hypothetical protein